MVYKNLFYLRNILNIGGIESWFNYLATKYGDIDITVACTSIDTSQYQRLKRKVRVIIWKGEDLECENFFCCFNTEIADHIKANNKYLVLHGNYLDMVNRGQLSRNLLPIKEGFKYLAISQNVADGWKKLTGIDSKVIYNPIVLTKHKKKMLRLCAAQRMSAEKGASRIERLVQELDRYINVHTEWDYELDIFTNDYGFNQVEKFSNTHIGLHKPRLSVDNIFGFYDWFICLSDDEGYGYSPVEALMRGTPCLITDLKIFTELGFTELNSVRLNLDCSNVQDVVEQLFSKKLSFVYEPKNDLFDELLDNSPKTYIFKEDDMARIKVQFPYFDTYEQVNVKVGDVYETTNERAKLITEGYQFINGAAINYAKYTDEPINVAWSIPSNESIEEKEVKSKKTKAKSNAKSKTE